MVTKNPTPSLDEHVVDGQRHLAVVLDCRGRDVDDLGAHVYRVGRKDCPGGLRVVRKV